MNKSVIIKGLCVCMMGLFVAGCGEKVPVSEYTLLINKDDVAKRGECIAAIQERLSVLNGLEIRVSPEGSDKIKVVVRGVQADQLPALTLTNNIDISFRMVDGRTMTRLEKNVLKAEVEAFPTNFGNPPVIKGITLPTGVEWLPYWVADEYMIPQHEGWLPVHKDEGVSGREITKAGILSRQDGSVGVKLLFNEEGAKKLYHLTMSNLDARLAIIVDGKVRIAPRISSPIADGQALLFDGFTADEYRNMARMLDFPAIPVELKVIKKIITTN